MRFDTSVLSPNPNVRRLILEILDAALDAVDPYRAILNALHLDGERLTIGNHSYNLSRFERIFVIGAGKAGDPMTRAIEAIFGERLTDGLVVVKTGHKDPNPTPTIRIVEAAHPIPDENGVAAGQEILALAESATERDLVITLISGGGSALLVAPADGLTLDDIQQMTDALIVSGATINEINCLRKHCSAIKGGQLTRAAAPATMLTLVLSDVVGNPLDVIASGPTVPDSSSWADAWEIIVRYKLEERLPAAIVERLCAGREGHIPETPTADDPAFARSQTIIVGDNRIAAVAAAAKAKELGFNTLLLTTYLQGEAREIAQVAVALGREICANGDPIAAPACLILGGETTVQLGKQPGKGGRNQELALAAAIALHGTNKITIVALATDGTDGPTDSAGALADGKTVARGREKELHAAHFLSTHNAYPYLTAVNDMLLTGPTQTNVNDLLLIFVDE